MVDVVHLKTVEEGRAIASGVTLDRLCVMAVWGSGALFAAVTILFGLQFVTG